MPMFGYYDIPLKIAEEGISLSIDKEGEAFIYKRECLDEKVEKVLLANKGKVLINPVEPLSKPKELTQYLYIEFERPLLVEPKESRRLFLKFPVEIGVFISERKHFEILDIFTLAKQKFTLYGDPRNGVICKYWKSEVYPSMPSINPLHEGIIELQITNSDTEWVEVTKSIFDAYGMKIYYSSRLVSLKARMKIVNAVTAETDFLDSPVEKEMKKATELYTAKKLPIVTTKFVMREGI